MKTPLPISALAVLLAAGSSQAAPAQDRIVIRGGKIVPIVEPDIEGGAILIENGKITAVGKDVETPYDAKVIDATGKVVFPGMIEAHTNRGIDRPNETYPVTPFLSVSDSLDGSSFYFEDALRDGITTLHVVPGNLQPIAGRGMVVRPVGRTVENMAIVFDAALKMSLVPSRPGSSHVTQLAEIRRAFAELEDSIARSKEKVEDEEEAEREKREQEKGKKPAAREDPSKRVTPREIREEDEIDRRKRVLADLTKGRVPVFVYAGAGEVAMAVDLAKKHGFHDRTTFVLAADAWRAADALAKTGRPVVLDPDLVHRERDPITGKEVETPVPTAFAKRNVKFALQTEGTSLSQRYMNAQAAAAVRLGVPRETALKAITLWPAEILGLGDRLGALAKGRDANVLILSGDPLATTTFVDTVILDGYVQYERAKDERLKRLLEVAASPPASASQPGEEKKSDAASREGDKK